MPDVEVRKSVMYAVTFTLSHKSKRSNSEQQFDIVENLIYGKEIFKDFSCTLTAELTQNFDVHVHGFMQIDYRLLDMKYHNNPARAISDIVKKTKELGFCCIKQLTDHEGWLSYIRKDFMITYKTLNRFPLIIDDFIYFPDGNFCMYKNDNIPSVAVEDILDDVNYI